MLCSVICLSREDYCRWASKLLEIDTSIMLQRCIQKKGVSYESGWTQGWIIIFRCPQLPMFFFLGGGGGGRVPLLIEFLSWHHSPRRHQPSPKTWWDVIICPCLPRHHFHVETEASLKKLAINEKWPWSFTNIFGPLKKYQHISIISTQRENTWIWQHPDIKKLSPCLVSPRVTSERHFYTLFLKLGMNIMTKTQPEKQAGKQPKQPQRLR